MTGIVVSARRLPTGLLATVAVVYLLASYGGIRSPDSELVFRTSVALVTRGSFALERDLPWAGFGVAPGRDGRRYAVFGPGQSVLWAPWTATALALERTGWFRRWPLAVPVSPYAGTASGSTAEETRARDALRMVTVLPYSLVSAAIVALFYALARRVSGSRTSALAASLLLGFGTLLLPYSGTFFSEPLATLLALASLACAVHRGEVRHGELRSLAAGLLLGGAVAVHVTAVLFAPFFLAVAAWPRRAKPRWGEAAGFVIGLLAVGGVLAGFNWLRFGDPFETGRTVGDLASRFGYGTWVAPWRGLAALLVSPGKGLLLFCPAVLLAVPAWPALHRRAPVLSWALLGAVGVRVVFIASRSDWHGGFCLGPRLLVPLIPFVLLPVACWLAEGGETVRRGRLLLVAVAAVLCTWQQVYFALGEVFSFLQTVKADWLGAGVNPFVDDLIYLDWSSSPLFRLLPGRLGPWPLADASPGGLLLWGSCALVAGGALGLTFSRLAHGERRPSDRSA